MMTYRITQSAPHLGIGATLANPSPRRRGRKIAEYDYAMPSASCERLPRDTQMQEDLYQAHRLISKHRRRMSTDEFALLKPYLEGLCMDIHYASLYDPAWINRDRTFENEQ